MQTNRWGNGLVMGITLTDKFMQYILNHVMLPCKNKHVMQAMHKKEKEIFLNF
jgi:hypothetical protein